MISYSTFVFVPSFRFNWIPIFSAVEAFLLSNYLLLILKREWRKREKINQAEMFSKRKLKFKANIVGETEYFDLEFNPNIRKSSIKQHPQSESSSDRRVYTNPLPILLKANIAKFVIWIEFLVLIFIADYASTTRLFSTTNWIWRSHLHRRIILKFTNALTFWNSKSQMKFSISKDVPSTGNIKLLKVVVQQAITSSFPQMKIKPGLLLLIPIL